MEDSKEYNEMKKDLSRTQLDALNSHDGCHGTCCCSSFSGKNAMTMWILIGIAVGVLWYLST